MVKWPKFVNLTIDHGQIPGFHGHGQFFFTIDHGVNSRVSWSWSVPYPPPQIILSEREGGKKNSKGAENRGAEERRRFETERRRSGRDEKGCRWREEEKTEVEGEERMKEERKRR